MTRADENMKEGQLGDFFSWIGTYLKSLWTKVPQPVKDDLKLFFQTFEQAAVAAVAKEALNVTMSGGAKFDSAVANMKDQITAAGWNAATTAIETLVQDAYISHKASQGETLVTPPAIN